MTRRTDTSDDTNSRTFGKTYADSEPWWEEPTRPPAGSPDVIVMVLDDVGFGSFGCYGSEIDTPNIDALASDGMQYSNFHATALCSPTRASLLTGRNHHSVGMSLLSNADSGHPSKRGAVTRNAATIAETLRENGYSTVALGKWHLTPMDQTSSVGPFEHWPLGRGFDHFYGFIEGLNDHFYPELVRDNSRVPAPKTPEEGYHLSEDLVEEAISFLADQKSLAPDKPYFMYLAFGAAHTPHHAPQRYLDKYQGRYDEGWDVIREQRLRKQIELGLVPANTTLTPRNEGVQPWADLTDDDRRIMARMQEAFAAMVDHTDAQIGRLLARLEELGTRENTLVVLMSDNGASQEGGLNGTTNTIAFENGDVVSTAQNLKDFDDIGGPRNHTNYPHGWAQAGNTPLKRYKQNVHAGGIRVPLVLSWPAAERDISTPMRHQFHSVIDIAPTIFAATGATVPAMYQGIEQMPIHGTSMMYTFADADVATVRHTQYFEMYGHRAIWHDGWKAVAYHERHSRYEDDIWELYHLDEDVSECHDLAQQEPDRLAALIKLWWQEAERYGVFPLDDRNFAERAAKYHSPVSPRRFRSYRLHRGMSLIPGGVTPLIYDRSYDLLAHVQASTADAGVLLAQGDVNGGHILYVHHGALHYEYNHQGTRYRTSGPLPARAIRELGVRVIKTGELQARTELVCDGEVIGKGTLASTARYMIGWQGLTVGYADGSPVTWDVDLADGYPFSGVLSTIDVELHPDGPHDVHEIID